MTGLKDVMMTAEEAGVVQVLRTAKSELTVADIAKELKCSDTKVRTLLTGMWVTGALRRRFAYDTDKVGRYYWSLIPDDETVEVKNKRLRGR